MSRHSDLITEKFEFASGSEVINGITIANFTPDTKFPEATEPSTAVFGNGAFGSVHTFGPIVRGYLREAARQGQPVQAVTYFDPWFGSGAYTADYRAERLYCVAQHAADVIAAQKVDLVGHSWSWPGAVAVAGTSPDILSTLVGYTPVGHRGKAPALGKLGILKACTQEGIRTKPAITLETVPAMGALAIAATGRLLAWSAMHEAINLFSLDLTEDVAKIRKNLPVGILIAQKDALFEVPADARAQLEAAGIITGDLATTHSGAVMHPKYGAELYHLAESLPPHLG